MLHYNITNNKNLWRYHEEIFCMIFIWNYVKNPWIISWIIRKLIITDINKEWQ